MEGNRRRFSKGWFTGLVLGTAVAGGAAVYAVTIPHAFQDGQTASAAQVNANFEALRDAINGSGPCADEMVRVGSSCLDTTASYIASIPAGCEPTGRGCAAIVTGASPGVPFSWGHAVAACNNAGKRLATGREIIAGFNAGSITVAEQSFLYSDSSAARSDAPYAGTHVYLGQGGTFQLGGTQTSYTELFPNAQLPNSIVGFRCAR